MKGNIYETEGGYIVRFGRKISRRFKSLPEAERFLTGLRYETDRGTFDERDYSAGNPLAFDKLADQWLTLKRQQIRDSTYASLRKYVADASGAWGFRNIKTIGYAEIEDHLLSLSVGQKTKANIKSVLHDFFTWCVKRRVIQQLPEFPSINFELAWRRIISPDDQAAILEEIRRISGHNPKIYLGIRMLCTYLAVRPGELVKVLEKDILLDEKIMVIRYTKDKKTKIIPLLDEDVKAIKEMPEGFPLHHFFRHTDGTSGVKAGKPFSQKYLWSWWKRACGNLGFDGIDLYGGTRHSTAVALKNHLSPEQIRAGTMHSTNKAFERYIQSSTADARSVYEMIRGKVQKAEVIDLEEIKKAR